MKINNKNGFTLVELLAVIVLVSIVSTLAVVSVSYIIKTGKISVYKNHEKALENSVKNYIIDSKDEIDFNSLNKINIYYSDLIDKQYMNELKDPNGGDCSDSYVIIEKNNSSINLDFNYKTCLICKKGSQEIYRSLGC